nr:MAG TPA: hypothetical protein [Caudoviricetes sp.]
MLFYDHFITLFLYKLITKILYHYIIISLSINKY